LILQTYTTRVNTATCRIRGRFTLIFASTADPLLFDISHIYLPLADKTLGYAIKHSNSTIIPKPYSKCLLFFKYFLSAALNSVFSKLSVLLAVLRTVAAGH
jgi:hypothetical protein